jgi:hypothetical protein
MEIADWSTGFGHLPCLIDGSFLRIAQLLHANALEATLDHECFH